MRVKRESLYHRIEPLLANVEKPVRYLGQEWGSETSQEGPFHACMVYADTYEVGQPNLGIAILYNQLNACEGISCERAFLPWKDMNALMRKHHIPACSLESTSPLASFDMIGFTLAHELVATNILELLDLAGITQIANLRDDDDPFILAGGPSAWNVEPMAALFDAVLLGDGEQHIVDVACCIRDGKERGLSRGEILENLAAIEGTYVPSLYEIVVDANSTRWGYAVPKGDSKAPEVVYKRCIQDFASTQPIAQKIVPYMSIVQDRLALEVLRGCARGCRFCQAGMTYRPVRERPLEQVVSACSQALQTSGYDEVSLSSLSTTDHSQCARIVRSLNERFGDSGVRVSIPSQRLDSFGMEMAAATCGARKSGLTFAPEAGTQRLRDVINKNVGDDDLERAARIAFESGWRRVKLYFMMGLPTETDEDIAAIPAQAARVLEIGREVVGRGVKSGIQVSVSVSVFVPKAYTPFQWQGQLRFDEVKRRQALLLACTPKDRDIKISYHDARTSQVEGALSKMGREGFALLMAAWKRGCTFDAWTSEFQYELWQEAARDIGYELEDIASEEFNINVRLPWDHTSPAIDKGFLQREWKNATLGITTQDCTFTSCTGCGVCPTLGVHNSIIEERS